eukprot:CAMPEP_0194284752 /NCGR_PEP_ID=MMETSP0169-20130528/28480_1 /TAXON_ID=218684 /ORGANISM="Corethron pennatum, Strain L29A3" /LENGTH=157 /DNA_ID=CAMNT_0039030665 /DNA_START=990 /DNA_END=1460 /DNA_ORIENTATION=-
MSREYNESFENERCKNISQSDGKITYGRGSSRNEEYNDDISDSSAQDNYTNARSSPSHVEEYNDGSSSSAQEEYANNDRTVVHISPRREQYANGDSFGNEEYNVTTDSSEHEDVHKEYPDITDPSEHGNISSSSANGSFVNDGNSSSANESSVNGSS